MYSNLDWDYQISSFPFIFISHLLLQVSLLGLYASLKTEHPLRAEDNRPESESMLAGILSLLQSSSNKDAVKMAVVVLPICKWDNNTAIKLQSSLFRTTKPEKNMWKAFLLLNSVLINFTMAYGIIVHFSTTIHCLLLIILRKRFIN